MFLNIFHYIFFIFITIMFYDTSTFWQILLIVILVCDKVWLIYLYYRQITVLKKPYNVPRILTKYITLKQMNQLRVFALHRMKFNIWKIFIGTLMFGCLELYLGLFPFLWTVAQCLSQSDNETILSLIFVFLLSLYVTLKLTPSIVYEKCILDREETGEIEGSSILFLLSSLKAIIINQVYLLPLTYVLILIAHFGGKYTIYFMWLLIGIISIILTIAVPLLFEPIVFKFTNDIPEKFYDEIFYLTKFLDFPISRIYIMKTKDALACGNAYFFGMACLKRIVLSEALFLDRGNTQQKRTSEIGRGLLKKQLAAVVAHELGHWNGCHFFLTIILTQVHLFFSVMLIGLLYENELIYEGVGFEHGVCPIIVGIILALWFIITPYTRLADLLSLWVLRSFEYSADSFAQDLGYAEDLQSGLLKMYYDCPYWPFFDSLYLQFYRTHPTIIQRIEYLNSRNSEE